MPDTPKRPLKAFLCHAHADYDAVHALYTRLTQDGVDVWLDKEKLLPGEDWEMEIRKAVREADVVVVCLSEQFNEAGYQQKEVRLALDTAMEKPEGEIFIIPARLEECNNLEQLRKWHLVDLFKNDGYEKLVQALRSRADKIGAFFQIDNIITKQKPPRPAFQVNSPQWLMKINEWWNRLPAVFNNLIIGFFGVLIGVFILKIFGPCLGCEYQKLPQTFQIPLIFIMLGGSVTAIINALIKKEAAFNKTFFGGLGLLLALITFLLWISTSEGETYARPQCSPTPKFTVTSMSTFTPTFTPAIAETPTPTSTITPTPTPDCGGIQVSQLKLNLATSSNQIRVPDTKGVINLTSEEIGTLAILSGEAIRTDTKGTECVCKWKGKINVNDAWEPADGEIGCGFSITIPKGAASIYLKLSINGQDTLFTIKVQQR